MPDQRQGLLATGAGWQGAGRERLFGWRRPVQQREDPLPSGLGGGGEPAEVADALKAFGQDVLQKAAEKFGGGKPENAPLLVSAVFVFEGDLAVVSAEDAPRAKGGVVNVSRQILDRRLAAAGGLDIHDPFLPPDRKRNSSGIRSLRYRLSY